MRENNIPSERSCKVVNEPNAKSDSASCNPSRLHSPVSAHHFRPTAQLLYHTERHSIKMLTVSVQRVGAFADFGLGVFLIRDETW